MPSLEQIDKTTHMLPPEIAPISETIEQEVLKGSIVHRFCLECGESFKNGKHVSTIGNDEAKTELFSCSATGIQLSRPGKIEISAYAKIPQPLDRILGLKVPQRLRRFFPKPRHDVRLAIQPRRPIATYRHVVDIEELQKELLSRGAENPYIYDMPYAVVPSNVNSPEIWLRFVGPADFHYQPLGRERLVRVGEATDVDGKEYSQITSIRRGSTLTALVRREANQATFRVRRLVENAMYEVSEGFFAFTWGGQDRSYDPPIQELMVKEVILHDRTPAQLSRQKKEPKNYSKKLVFKDGHPRFLNGSVYVAGTEMTYYEYSRYEPNGTAHSDNSKPVKELTSEKVFQSGITNPQLLFSFGLAFTGEDRKIKPPLIAE